MTDVVDQAQRDEFIANLQVWSLVLYVMQDYVHILQSTLSESLCCHAIDRCGPCAIVCCIAILDVFCVS